METRNLTTEEINEGVKALLEEGYSGRYQGNDNSGKPKAEYLRKLVQMTDEKLRKECKSRIWLSAYAGNNQRSDYHWKCDACFDESRRRKKVNIYEDAFQEVEKGM